MAVLTGGQTNLDSVRALILPHIESISGAQFKKKDKIHDVIFELKDTKMFYDEMVEVAPLGTFKRKEEMEETRSDGMRQNFKTKATQVDYALAHRISDKAIRFANPDALALESGEHLARAAFHSLETLATLVLDRSRNSSYVGGDSKELIATDHPLIDGSSASNELATAQAFSQAGIHELLILQRNLVDPRGNPMAVKGNKLIVPTSKYIKAQEIMKTMYQVDTANNTANVIVQNKLLPGGILNLDYSSDSDAYYVLADKSDVPNGMCCLRSADLEVDADVDKSTRTINVYAFFSNVFFWHDWRQIVGTAGA